MPRRHYIAAFAFISFTPSFHLFLLIFIISFTPFSRCWYYLMALFSFADWWLISSFFALFSLLFIYMPPPCFSFCRLCRQIITSRWLFSLHTFTLIFAFFELSHWCCFDYDIFLRHALLIRHFHIFAIDDTYDAISIRRFRWCRYAFSFILFIDASIWLLLRLYWLPIAYAYLRHYYWCQLISLFSFADACRHYAYLFSLLEFTLPLYCWLPFLFHYAVIILLRCFICFISLIIDIISPCRRLLPPLYYFITLIFAICHSAFIFPWFSFAAIAISIIWLHCFHHAVADAFVLPLSITPFFFWYTLRCRRHHDTICFHAMRCYFFFFLLLSAGCWRHALCCHIILIILMPDAITITLITPFIFRHADADYFRWCADAADYAMIFAAFRWCFHYLMIISCRLFYIYWYCRPLFFAIAIFAIRHTPCHDAIRRYAMLLDYWYAMLLRQMPPARYALLLFIFWYADTPPPLRAAAFHYFRRSMPMIFSRCFAATWCHAIISRYATRCRCCAISHFAISPLSPPPLIIFAAAAAYFATLRFDFVIDYYWLFSDAIILRRALPASAALLYYALRRHAIAADWCHAARRCYADSYDAYVQRVILQYVDVIDW